jgi:hypothetical protein
LGKLNILLKKAKKGGSMTQKRNSLEVFNEWYKKENELTKEALADVLQYLSHDTSTTRRQLKNVLMQRANLIELPSANLLAQDLLVTITEDPSNEGSIAGL